MGPGEGNVYLSRGGVDVKPAFKGAVHAIYAVGLRKAVTASIDGQTDRTSEGGKGNVEFDPTAWEGPSGKGMEGWTAQAVVICSCGGFSLPQSQWIWRLPRLTTGPAPPPLLVPACNGVLAEVCATWLVESRVSTLQYMLRVTV